MGRSRIVAAVAAVCTVGVVVGVAAAGTVTAPVTVSGPSPFTSACDYGQTTSYLNSEAEPSVAVNPTNPNNIVTTWQQDRWGAPSSGGGHGLGTGSSSDGGLTWSSVFVPFTLCAGGTTAGAGDYERATDPWVTFGPTGIAYQASLAFDWTQNRSTIAVSRSLDGGQTWGTPRQVARISKGSFNTLDDKETITADPFDPNVVYAVWIRYVQPPSSFKRDSGLHTQKGVAMFSRSLDQGQTWSEPMQIAKSDEAQANQIVVLDDGTLVNLFDDLTFSNKGGIASINLSYVKSTDRGATWSAKRVVTDVSALGTYAPNAAVPADSRVRSGGLIDVAARGQTIYVTYPLYQRPTPARPNGHDRIALIRSDDGGATWSAPRLVGLTPRFSGDWRTWQQFTPSVDINTNGKVAVTYYDFRNDTDAGSAPATTDYWVDLFDTDGTFLSEERLTPTSFDIGLAPQTSGSARGYFLGDYQGLASASSTFVASFAVTGGFGATDIVTAKVTP